MCDSRINIFQRIINVALEFVVLSDEVIEPEVHSGVLLDVIGRRESHLFVHRGKVLEEDIFDDFNF